MDKFEGVTLLALGRLFCMSALENFIWHRFGVL